jgi:hypothetical protein
LMGLMLLKAVGAAGQSLHEFYDKENLGQIG